MRRGARAHLDVNTLLHPLVQRLTLTIQFHFHSLCWTAVWELREVCGGMVWKLRQVVWLWRVRLALQGEEENGGGLPADGSL